MLKLIDLFSCTIKIVPQNWIKHKKMRLHKKEDNIKMRNLKSQQSPEYLYNQTKWKKTQTLDESSFSFNRFGVQLCTFSAYHGSLKDLLKEKTTSMGWGWSYSNENSWGMVSPQAILWTIQKEEIIKFVFVFKVIWHDYTTCHNHC